MSIWSSRSFSGGPICCPFAELRDQVGVFEEDINLCPFAQLRVYQEDIN